MSPAPILRKTFRVALLALLALLLAALPAHARVIGRSAEVSIGREAASVIEQYLPVDRDPVALARVRNIGRRLAACAKDPNFPFEFHVVEAAEVNAFALPGGFIYVFRGLIQLLPNDDALASVLAHEVSHVTERHSIEQFEKNLLLQAGITAILRGTGANGWGNAAAVVHNIVGLSFTRGDETEADAEGIRLLARAGYDVRAAAEAMRVVKRASPDDRGIPALLRSHPAPDSRIAKLSQLAEALHTERKVALAAGPRKTAAAPAIPAQPGLEKLALRPCPWLPLRPGAEWEYRVTGGGTLSVLRCRVLEALAGAPAGTARLEMDWGSNLRSTHLLASAGDRILFRSEAPGVDAWSEEAVFTDRTPHRFRIAGPERVTVPAGTYEALKIERLEGGQVLWTAWYARDVGLVRKEHAGTGVVQELALYRDPGGR